MSTYKQYSWVSEYNVFQNNIFKTYSHNPFSTSNSNSFYDNYLGLSDSSTFINGFSQFTLQGNYHLKSTSPGKNGGSDGTDIGIYGGAYPWGDGNFPSNPHIIYKEIVPITKSDGTLPVKIIVRVKK